MNLSKIIDRSFSPYDKYLWIGAFNSETSETALGNFCNLYNLKNLVRELFITNCSRSFQGAQVIQTSLSDFSQNESNNFKCVFY